MKLILAEKPSLGKAIAQSLGIKGKNSNGSFEGNGIIVSSLVGHVIAASYPKTPWTLESLPIKGLSDPLMKPGADKEKIVSAIKKEIQRSDVTEIINAGDADAEGSLLVYELYEHFGVINSGKKFSRMWMLAVDAKTIKKAYEERYDQADDMRFVNAAKSRSLADVRLGFNFSRLYTLKNPTPRESFAIGRVMTPTMQIVRERELEIQGFVPEDYWNITGNFNSKEYDFKGEAFFINDENKQSTALNKEVYEKFKKDIKKGDKYMVSEKTVKSNSKKPDLLPNLNDILKAMSKLHKMNSKKATSVMQFLYENKFCTYPRSESKFLPTSMEDEVNEAYECYTNLYSDKLGDQKAKFDVNNKRVFDNKKVGSHFAIIPMERSQSQIAKLDADQTKVFDYIVSKFIMSFMGDYKYESTVIVLKDGDITFKITGKIEKEKGFKQFECESNKTEQDDVIVPPIEKGQSVEMKGITTKKKKTTPPAVITELSLLEIMENVHKLYKKQKQDGVDEDDDIELEFDGAFSLGTPATRGGIIDKLQNLKYLKKTGQKFIVTDIGVRLLNTAKGALNIETTATFEEDMANITAGKLNHMEFDKKIELYVGKLITTESTNIQKIIDKRIEDSKTTIECPLCNAAVIDTGKAYRCKDAGSFDKKNKRFTGCQFSIMKYIKPLDHEITESQLKGMIAGEKVDVGGKGLVFDKSSSFFIKIDMPKTGVECPLCKSDVIDTGKAYRCKDAGSFDPKKKRFTGCQFSIMKYIKPLDHEITEDELRGMIAGEKIDVGGKGLVFDKDSSFFVKIDMPSTGVACPLCKGDVVDTGKAYRCKDAGSFDPKKKKFTGCQFSIMKYIKPLSHNITKDELKLVLSGEKVDIGKSKIRFDKNDNFFIKIEFENQSKAIEGKCPKCKSEMMDAGKQFRCKETGKWNPKKKKMDGSCDFSVWKNQRKIDRDLTTEEMNTILQDGLVNIEGSELILDLKNKYFIS